MRLEAGDGFLMLSSPRRTIQTGLGALTLLRLLLFLGATVASWVSAPFATLFSLFGFIFALLLISGTTGAVSLILDRRQGFIGFYVYYFVATFGMVIFVLPLPV